MRRLIVIVCAAMLIAVGCGEDNGNDVQVEDADVDTEAGTTTTTEAPEPEPSDPIAATTSEFLYIEGDLTIPEGDEGEVSIVMVGTPDEYSVPIVLRNMTDDPVSRIEVSGSARNAAGDLVGSGSSQGTAPSVVQPGEWAFGFVFFGAGGNLPPDADFDLTVASETFDPRGFFASLDVLVTEVSIQPDEFTEGNIIGIVTNPHDEVVEGPVSVAIVCFVDEQPTLTTSTFTDGDSIPEGGTASFEITLFDSCPEFAIGGSGYNY